MVDGAAIPSRTDGADAVDPRRVLDLEPMRWRQVVAITVCVLLNALDGFDVLAISFAAPGIAAEWNIDRGALGLVLSMELFGMAAGSVLLGGLADRVGRRPTILACLGIMAVGMGLAPFTTGIVMLSAIRLFTGIGIGGMLAGTNAMVAEQANARNRALAVTIMAAGYPLGAIVGGTVASSLLGSGGWRDVFTFGCIATTMFLPCAWWLLPETVGFLVERRPRDALARINAALCGGGHQPLLMLPPVVAQRPPVGVPALFKSGLAATTTLLTVAYFAHIMTFYFTLKWIPKIVVDLGEPPATAGGVLVWANVGGLTGALLLGLLSRRWPVRPLIIAALAGAVASVIGFGQASGSLNGLKVAAALAGFFTNAGVVGLYALIAQSFPGALRGSGTGFVIGIGRAGAALGPIAAGGLFAAGGDLALVAGCMACGSAIAAVALIMLRGKGNAAVSTILPKHAAV
jgi:benzoate transport